MSAFAVLPGRFDSVSAAPPALQPVASPQALAVIDPAVAASVQSTIEAQAATLSDQTRTVDAQAGTIADQNRTIAAQATEIAQLQRGTPVSLIFERNVVSIPVDADAVLAGDPQALDAARQELEHVLGPYQGRSGTCVGVVLTFAHRPGFDSANVKQGYRLAARINEVMAAEFPDLVGGAVFEAYGNLTPPDGQIDLHLYLSNVTGANCPEPAATPLP
jgi:hypothetical protein